MLNNTIILHTLNAFFIIFHSLLIIFNLTGFLFKATRFANLICLLITGFSWFILGIWYGFGYCFLVDWHWAIRQKLGFYRNQNSYIKFMIDNITSFDVNAELIDITTGILYCLALLASITLNARDYLRRKS